MCWQLTTRWGAGLVVKRLEPGPGVNQLSPGLLMDHHQFIRGDKEKVSSVYLSSFGVRFRTGASNMWKDNSHLSLEDSLAVHTFNFLRISCLSKEQ